MVEIAYGTVGEVLGFVVTALGSALFTVVGLLTERAAIANILAGHSTFGLWELYMGALALVVGLYFLGYERAWGQFRALRRAA